MKMVLAVIPRAQGDVVLEALIRAGHTATFSESRGGVLQQAQTMLFIAVAKEDLDKVLGIIHENCHSEIMIGSAMTSPLDQQVKAEVGGAVIFVWDLDQFIIY